MKPLALVAGIVVAMCSCATTHRADPEPQDCSPRRSTTTTDNVVVLPLTYADAQDLKDVLVELLNASKRQGRGCTLYLPGLVGRNEPEPAGRIVADARTNSLICASFDSDDLATLRELVAKLDVTL